MLVNYYQISYALQIPLYEAKLIVSDAEHVLVSYLVESSTLGYKFKHPSPDLDGKDIIEYTIKAIRAGGVNNTLAQAACDDLQCISKGRLCGKYKRLNHIFSKQQLAAINDIIKKRHEEANKEASWCE